MGVFTDIEKYGNCTAVIWNDNQYTYKTLVDDADSLAKEVNGRCMVFVVCQNTYPSLMGYVSFLRNDIVPLMINSAIDKEMFSNLVNVYKPKFIWQPIDFTDGESVFSKYDYELISTGSIDYDINDKLALLLTTSGSTGSPKYVRQSYDNILSNANSIIEYLDIKESDRAITTLPMSYTYGLSIINTHLIMGASLILTDYTIVQREFWNLLKKYEANNFGGVPYTYEMLKRMRFERMDLNLRYITQAGGKLGKELHSEFAKICVEKGIKLIIMYGQTEATARMSWLPFESTVEKAGSIGVAIPGGKFSLIDVDGKEITEPNISGELIYKGANVTLGYATSYEDLALGDERNGSLETGDMAYVDEDGYYYISGRKKRFLKVYGNRLNLDEVDELLRSEGYEAVSAGEDNHVKIFAVNGEAEEIISFLVNKTNLNFHAFEVVKIDSIPRSESGKVLYKDLK